MTEIVDETERLASMEPEWSRRLRELTLEVAPLVGQDRDAAARAVSREITRRGVEIDRLRGALGFYADPATYLAHGPLPPSQSSFEDPAIDLDRGGRARATLEGGRP